MTLHFSQYNHGHRLLRLNHFLQVSKGIKTRVEKSNRNDSFGTDKYSSFYFQAVSMTSASPTHMHSLTHTHTFPATKPPEHFSILDRWSVNRQQKLWSVIILECDKSWRFK